MDWEKFAWIRRGRRRKKVLEIIYNSDRPLSATDLKKKLHVSLPQISLILKELTDNELIKCLNPNDKIGKIYTISREGEKIVNEL